MPIEDKLPLQVNPAEALGISSPHRRTWSRGILNYEAHGANVAYVDAHVHFLPENTPEERIRSMLTIAAGD